MLTERDYCDYETCVALKEIGCRMETEWYIHQPSYERGACYLCFGIPRETSVLDECDYIPRLSLYEAQRWLREEKGIHISIDYDEFDWSYCLFDCSKKHYKQLSNCRMYFKSYEEALLNGIKVSVDFLKGE